MLFFGLVTIFDLKPILSAISVATQTLFCLPFSWNICFPFLLLTHICVFRQHIGESFLKSILPVCLLIGEFNSFIFKLIIDGKDFCHFAVFCIAYIIFIPLFLQTAFFSVFFFFSIVLFWFPPKFLFLMYVGYFLIGYPGNCN